MKKIAHLSPRGVAEMVIYYDEKADRNPYRVYLEWNEITDRGLMPRRRQIVRYADLLSAVYEMHEYAKQHNEDRRG